SKEFGKAADVLHARGQPVIWLTAPPIDLDKNVTPNRNFPVEKPERLERMNDLLREVAKSRPWMHVVDYASYADKWPGGALDATLRPDGVNIAPDAANQMMKDWLGKVILDIVRDYRATLAAATGTNPVGVPEPK